ncbi:hypothetical protein BH24PSE2_BH24PSE2_02870 [soil metagenome]
MKDDRQDADKALERATAALPRELEPERDLWPEIAARINPAPSTVSPRWTRSPAQLAAAVTLVAIASLTAYLLVEPRAPRSEQIAWADIWAEPARFGARDTLSQDYLDARRALATTLEDRLEALPTETRAVVVTNLLEIRRALDAINAELAEDPDNVLLQRLLLRTYQDEMYVLVNLNSTTEPVMENIEI